MLTDLQNAANTVSPISRLLQGRGGQRSPSRGIRSAGFATHATPPDLPDLPDRCCSSQCALRRPRIASISTVALHPASAAICGQSTSEADTFEEDGPQNYQEVAQRYQIGDRLHRRGHVLDPEHEPRQHHRNEEKNVVVIIACCCVCGWWTRTGQRQRKQRIDERRADSSA